MTSPLLSDFLARCADVRAHHPALAQVFRESLHRIGWPQARLEAWDALPEEDVAAAGPQAVVYRTGMALAKLAEADTSAAYHNRDHTAEAVLSAAVLAQAEPWTPPARQNQGLKFLVAMMAHDVGHTGAFGAPKGSLEQSSAQVFSQVWSRFAGPDPGSMARADHAVIQSVILGTEFTEGPRLNADNLLRDPSRMQYRIQVMANDADILASVLPQTGPERGQLLAQEWSAAGPHAAAASATVGTWAGRLGFLKAIRLTSLGAQALGAARLREREIDTIEAIGPSQLAQMPHGDAHARVLEGVHQPAPSLQRRLRA